MVGNSRPGLKLQFTRRLVAQRNINKDMWESCLSGTWGSTGTKSGRVHSRACAKALR